MTYTPDMNSMSHTGGAYKIDQQEVERVLRNLMARQSGGHDAIFSQKLKDGHKVTTFEGWQSGQIEFARRIAQIGVKHAERHKDKFCWKHRSVGLLRRLALIVMVTTILAAQYI